MLTFCTGRRRNVKRMERHLKTVTSSATLVKLAEKTLRGKEETEREKKLRKEEERIKKSNKCPILGVTCLRTLAREILGNDFSTWQINNYN